MRLGFFAILSFLALVLPAGADEQFATLQAGNDTYTNVTVTTVTATDIYFTHAGGMGNAKIKDLSPDLKKHFHYNESNAAAVEQKRIQANNQYHALVAGQAVVRPPDEGSQPDGGTPPKALWRTDLPGALDQARSENKLVLLDFTGSDWCPWCIKFDHEVLSTDEFANYANARLVLVKLDFPRHTEQDAALKQANRELYRKFNVDGYPTYVLLNPSGKELGRQFGYAEGGPGAFIAELDGFSKR